MILRAKLTPKAAPPSEPSMTRGRSPSRKRSARGRSQTGRILREPYRYHLKGISTKLLCECWPPPECHFLKNWIGMQSRGQVSVLALQGSRITKYKTEKRGVKTVNSAPHTSLFLMQWSRTNSCTSLHLIHIVIHVMRLSVVRSLTLCSSLCSFPCVSPLLSSSTWTLSWTSPCGRHRGNIPLALRQLRSLALWPKTASHRLWVQAPWRFPLLGDYWNHLPGGIRRQRYGALVLVWHGTRRRDHRESALVTTVHSGARGTSGPKTSLSLFWRKFVASSVLVCLSCKNGETCAWT